MRSNQSLQSLDSLSIEGALDGHERQETSLDGRSYNGSGLQGGLGEAKHLMERLNAAQVKVKRLNRLEAAIVDFFMEVMDRSENNAGADNGVDVESAFARSKRKEQFLKKAEGDPISLLNSLRTHLRLKFAEQEAQQVAAERKAFADTISNQQKEENNRNEFQQMEQTCNLLKLQQETLIQQVTQHKLEQTRSHRQYRALLDKLNAQVQAHQSREQVAQELATKLRDEVAALKDTRDTLLKASQNQKPHDSNRVIGTTAAGANSVITPSVTNTDFFGTPAENQTLRRALQKYEAKMARMEATNDERKREIQRLQQQLTGLRQNTQLQKYERLEKDSRHLQELADDLKSRLDESDADLLRTKGSLKEREIQVQKMKDEYARLFNAVQKQKQPSHYSPSKLARAGSATHLTGLAQPTTPQHLPSKLFNAGIAYMHSQVSDSNGSTLSATNHMVEYYRSEAARVGREADALKLQIRRMMASEQLHKQKTRVLRAEKQDLMRERDQLRADLGRANRHSTLQSTAMNRQQTNLSSESRRGATRDTPQEVKRLHKRNTFLEERYRKSLQNNSSFASVGAVARLRGSMSVPGGLGLHDPAAEDPEDNSDEMVDHGVQNVTSKPRPASAQAVALRKPSVGSFKSLDAVTLQSLQQVKRATRVRPQSANLIK